MSQPPSPYGGGPQGPPGPPYGGPPYGGPPSPYPPQQQPGKPGGMSNKAKFWIGVALALPVVILGSIISGGISAAVDGITGNSSAAGAVGLLVGLGELAALVAAIVLARTRWFALGVVAGVAILLILAAGACVVLIVAFTASYN